METETSFTEKMMSESCGDAPVAFPPRANEAINITPSDSSPLIVNKDEVLRKSTDAVGATVTREECGDEPAPVVNDHSLNNREEAMNCDDSLPQELHSTGAALQSPLKSAHFSTSEPVYQAQPDGGDTVCERSEAKAELNNCEAADEVMETGGVEKKAEELKQEEDDEMESENQTRETVTEPPEPDSTPVKAEGDEMMNNDVHHSEGETKVEEVSGDGVHSNMEECSAEPVVEEPQEERGEDGADRPGEEHQATKNHQRRSKQQIEISDVTDKEHHIQENKSDEEMLLDHINTACQCLDDFMKTKDEVKIKDCMDLLTKIKSLAVKTVDTLHTLTPADKGQTSKKGKRGSKGSAKTKSSSKADRNDTGHESDSHDPLEEVNLKDINGLAVFAKWPNSGWFYPGVVRDLSLSDLIGAPNQNLTVTFYDGLERDMKSINIFPASLVPLSSVLFDLDDETDLTVATVETEGNWVKYIMKTSGDSAEVTKGFDKLAIKGAHMKTIKQAVDVASVVSVKSDNIVTGRRSRGKSSMFNEDYVSSSSPRSTEKRKSKSQEESPGTPDKAPAKRKSSSKDDESGDSTPSRTASKRRQVNGTKSTPRRAAKK